MPDGSHPLAEAHQADPIDVAAGARIRLRRKQLGISQSDLAAALNVSFQQVQKYERGANRVSASMLVRIAAKLETTVGALVGETADAMPIDNSVTDLLVSQLGQTLVMVAARLPSDRLTALVRVAQALEPEA